MTKHVWDEYDRLIEPRLSDSGMTMQELQALVDDIPTRESYREGFDAGRKAGFGSGIVYGIFVGCASMFLLVMLLMLARISGVLSK